MSNEKSGTSSNSLKDIDDDHVVPGTTNDDVEKKTLQSHTNKMPFEADVDKSDIISLQVENESFKFEKSLLINNSDYFRVMLEGNFKEKHQSTINLKGIKSSAMKFIMRGLHGIKPIFEYEDPEDIIAVLQTAIMLQFNEIEKKCIELLTENLELSNCIRIWVVAEQMSLRPLYLKAKLMALDEYMDLKNFRDIGDLTLEQVVSYLGSIYLKTDTEFSIFDSVMYWWTRNSTSYSENSVDILLKLLSCIDFQELDDPYFDELLLHPDIAHNSEITEILKCIRFVKMGNSIDDSHTEEIKERVKLLLNTTRRKAPGGLCILARTLDRHELDIKIKSLCANDKLDIISPNNVSEIVPEHIKKKRAVEVDRDKTNDIAILFYDERYPLFRKLFEVENRRCFDMDGFAIMGYKQQVFVYGGQYVMGRGEWNYNFSVWDGIAEKFDTRAHFPYPRRHFDTCRIDSTVFICGGTGVFRIFKDNVFWYDNKDDYWSPERPLPVPSDRQVKCCLFKDTLFVFSTITSCGYFFRQGEPIEWQEIKIELNSTVYSNNFVIFSYKDKLYFKGKMLIECTLEGNKMIMTSQKEIADFDFCKIEVVLINNIIYTYYEYSDNLALEWYDIETHEKKFIFRDVHNSLIIDTDEGEKYVITNKMKIFTYHYYGLLEDNALVNENFSHIK